MTFAYRIAHRLMEHANVVMPAGRKDWAEAMRSEFAAITNDREALAWASGCVWASYLERIDPMDVLLKSLVRAAALWLWPLCGVAVAAVIAVIRPRPEFTMDWFFWKAVHGLSILFAGAFLFLVVCEIAIARYWSAPGKIFQKTLVRSAAVWFWPFSATAFEAVIYPKQDFGGAPVLSDAVWNLSGIFAGVFVTLLICEWAISRYWPARQKSHA